MSFVDLAQETGSAAEFERAVLDRFERSIGFDCAFLFALDTLPTSLGLAPDFASRITAGTRAARYDREMLPVKTVALAKKGVAIDSEVLGSARFQLAYFRELAAPADGKHSLLGYLRLRGEVLGMVMLGRRRQSFGDGEVAALESALPSLAVARASFDAPRPCTLEKLSSRERELVRYLSLGYTNREIALACGTSANTVRNQLVSVFAKLGASTRAEAVGIARGA